MRNDHADLAEMVASLVDKRRTLAGRRLAGGALPGIGLAGSMGAGKDDGRCSRLRVASPVCGSCCWRARCASRGVR